MPDDEWASIARELPGGFAGLFFDTSPEQGVRHVQGPLVVMLTDTSRHEETLAAIAPRIAAMYGSRNLDVRGALVQRARWDFARLYDWYHYLSDVAWAGRDISGSDIDEIRNRIAYGAVDEEAKRRVEARLAARGIPCELVVVEVRGRIQRSTTRRPPPSPR
jgi:hypothetical protein